MRLTEKESLILSAAEMNARLPIHKLQEKTGYQSHTIRYTLKKLEDRGVIHPIAFVNLYRLGYTEFGIYFSLSTNDREDRLTILNHILANARVYYAAEVGGPYEYVIGIYTQRGVPEIMDFFDNIITKFGDVFLEKSIQVRYALSILNRGYLNPKTKRTAFHQMHTGEPITLTEKDWMIAHALQIHAHRSADDIARETGIAAATVRTRLKKLEQKKYIEGYFYSINPTIYNRQLFVLLISLRGAGKELREHIHAFAKKQEDIVYLHFGVGAWDLSVTAECKTASDASVLARALRIELGNQVQKIQTLPVFRYLKYSLGVWKQ